MEQLYKFTPEQLKEIEAIQLDFDTTNMSEGTIQAAKIRKYMMDNNLISPAQAGEPNSWSLVSEKKHEKSYSLSKDAFKEIKSYNRTLDRIWDTHREIEWELQRLTRVINKSNIKLSLNLLWFVVGVIFGTILCIV